MPPVPSTPMFSTLVVAGLGLIGGSVAAAAKSRGVAKRVVGFGRDANRMQGAVDAGMVDAVYDDASKVPDADLVVVCTPVDRIADDVRRLSKVLPADCLFTDAGSVKGAICESLRSDPPSGGVFVGGHPLAGSEKNGWQNADRDLFVDKLCVLTPVGNEPAAAIAQVEEFWQRLGMRVCRMTPDAHDTALALTSHLPHVAAAALAGMLTERDRPFAARGFRDTTRIAAGDADLWTAILRLNAGAVADRVETLVNSLQACAIALRAGDVDAVRDFLRAGETGRKALEMGEAAAGEESRILGNTNRR